jgi:translation elongation factor EF-Tu-like GTPase
VVATGRVESGMLRVGDEVYINSGRTARVDGIEAFRKKMDEATAGDNIGVLFKGLDKGDLSRGDVLSAASVV